MARKIVIERNSALRSYNLYSDDGDPIVYIRRNSSEFVKYEPITQVLIPDSVWSFIKGVMQANDKNS